MSSADQDAMSDARVEGDDDRGTAIPDEGTLLDAVDALWAATRSAMDQALGLVALEARYAAVSLAGIVALGVFVGAGLIAAWLLACAVGALWLVGHTGLGWAGALALMLVLTLVLVTLAVISIKSLSENLEFRFTRRQLVGRSSSSERASTQPTQPTEA